MESQYQALQCIIIQIPALSSAQSNILAIVTLLNANLAILAAIPAVESMRLIASPATAVVFINPTIAAFLIAEKVNMPVPTPARIVLRDAKPVLLRSIALHAKQSTGNPTSSLKINAY